MLTLLSILSGLLGLVNLVFLILILIKLFQEKGILHAILGFICFVYPLIWGWQNVDRLNIRNIMLIWSVCLALAIILNVIIRAMGTA